MTKVLDGDSVHHGELGILDDLGCASGGVDANSRPDALCPCILSWEKLMPCKRGQHSKVVFLKDMNGAMMVALVEEVFFMGGAAQELYHDMLVIYVVCSIVLGDLNQYLNNIKFNGNLNNLKL